MIFSNYSIATFSTSPYITKEKSFFISFFLSPINLSCLPVKSLLNFIEGCLEIVILNYTFIKDIDLIRGILNRGEVKSADKLLNLIINKGINDGLLMDGFIDGIINSIQNDGFKNLEIIILKFKALRSLSPTMCKQNIFDNFLTSLGNIFSGQLNSKEPDGIPLKEELGKELYLLFLHYKDQLTKTDEGYINGFLGSFTSIQHRSRRYFVQVMDLIVRNKAGNPKQTALRFIGDFIAHAEVEDIEYTIQQFSSSDEFIEYEEYSHFIISKAVSSDAFYEFILEFSSVDKISDILEQIIRSNNLEQIKRYINQFIARFSEEQNVIQKVTEVIRPLVNQVSEEVESFLSEALDLGIKS